MDKLINKILCYFKHNPEIVITYPRIGMTVIKTKCKRCGKILYLDFYD